MIRLGGGFASQGSLARKDRVPEIRSVNPSCWVLDTSELPNGGASCLPATSPEKQEPHPAVWGARPGVGPLRAKPTILLVHWSFFYFLLLLVSSFGRPGDSGP